MSFYLQIFQKLLLAPKPPHKCANSSRNFGRMLASIAHPHPLRWLLVMLSKVTSAWPCLILLLFASRCAVPTMRQTLLCRSSSSKCVTRWPTWRGECYPPPCCSTAAGWAQSTLWYPSFKSRPFSLFVWHALPFCSLYSTFSVGELTHWLLCVLHDVTVFGLCGSVSVVQPFISIFRNVY